jgi:hypothetical protein
MRDQTSATADAGREIAAMLHRNMLRSMGEAFFAA